MGWLWASPKNEPSTPAPSPDTTPLEPSSPPSNPNPPPNTPEEEPSPELTAFLTALRPPPPKPTPSPHTPSTLLTPRDIHPTTLSCRAAFDTAFYCASLGGQFTSLYRYGSLRACSQQWSDFWFCVRTNRGIYSDEERSARVLRRAMGREREKYGDGDGGLSSEDVWEQRERVVRGAFGGDYWGAVARAEKEAEGGGGGR